MAKDVNKIDKKTHNRWFEKCILSNNCKLFLGMFNGVKVSYLVYIRFKKK